MCPTLTWSSNLLVSVPILHYEQMARSVQRSEEVPSMENRPEQKTNSLGKLILQRDENLQNTV